MGCERLLGLVVALGLMGLGVRTDKRAAMVSNLLTVLVAEQEAQPVINTGTLYQ